MGMHWLGYDVGIVGMVGKNTFVMTLQVNCLAYCGYCGDLHYLVYVEMYSKI
jgi:hypothetical protein